MTGENLAETLLRRWSQMDAEFMRHASVWRSCLDVTFPERADGLEGDQVDAQTSQNKKAELLDPTGTDSARLLCSHSASGMTPSNSVWFQLDVGEETEEERRWLDGAARRMWEAIHSANYDSVRFETLMDSVCVGWSVMHIDEDRETGELMFDQWPIAQCRLSASKPGGAVDTVFRKVKMTAEQAFNAYGDKVGERVQRDLSLGKLGEMHEYIQAIYPRTKYQPGAGLARNLPIASCHVECATKRVVRESGYHEWPLAVPRWTKLPNSAYAVGPVSTALPAIRGLNELLRLEQIALARAAAGVYIAADDGVLNPRTVRVTGGNVIVANSVDSMKPLPTGADFNVTFSKADQMRAEIRKLLMADQLPPVDSPVRTATEFYARIGLIRQLLGPVFGRFQTEDLSPTVARVFGLMYRRGRPEIGGAPGPVLLDDAPESLAGLPFKVRFQSPLARAQKLEDVAAMERLAQMAGGLAAVGKPEALDLLDADQMLRNAQQGLGAPGDSLKGEKEVAQFRQARQEMQAQQAQQAQQQQMQTMAAEAALKSPAAA